MWIRSARLTTLLVLMSTQLMAQPNLLDDPGFGAATSGTLTSNSAWSLNVSLPDGVNFAGQFQDGAFASDPTDAANTLGFWFRSFEGQQDPGDDFAFVDLWQPVPNVGGGDYSLTFSVKRETFFLASSWTASLASDGSGGTDQIDLLADVPNDGTWVTRTLDLSGVSPGDDLTVSITMIDGQDAGSNPQSAFVDNFHLIPRGGDDPVAVPALSPTSMGLLVVFLGLAACWRLRS